MSVPPELLDLTKEDELYLENMAARFLRFSCKWKRPIRSKEAPESMSVLIPVTELLDDEFSGITSLAHSIFVTNKGGQSR